MGPPVGLSLPPAHIAAPEHEVRKEEEAAPQAAAVPTAASKLSPSPTGTAREPNTVVPPTPVAGSKGVN